MDFLSPERALIFRITHYQNLAWILGNGIQCRNSPLVDPKFTEIGRPEIIDRRRARLVDVPPGGTLSDYVPFYFNSKTPMLYNIKTGYQGLHQQPMNDIIIMVAGFRELVASGVTLVYSDRNATLAAAQFSTDLQGLNQLPWDLWRDDNFQRDDSRPDKIERYHSEALIHQSLPAQALKALVCYSEARKLQVEQMVKGAGMKIPVLCRERWYS